MAQLYCRYAINRMFQHTTADILSNITREAYNDDHFTISICCFHRLPIRPMNLPVRAYVSCSQAAGDLRRLIMFQSSTLMRQPCFNLLYCSHPLPQRRPGFCYLALWNMPFCRTAPTCSADDSREQTFLHLFRPMLVEMRPNHDIS